jgi:TP901 family phage tail tape measure protein
MALNNLGLGFVFTARDLASGTIRQVGAGFGHLDASAARATSSYQRNFAIMGAGLGIMGAGVATLAGAFELAQSAAAFEQGIARVGAISLASADELRLLHDAAIQAGIATQFTPTQATEGLAALASQGLNARESIAALTPALDLAAGGGISVEAATRAMGAAFNVFGISVDRAGLVADQFLRISNATALEANDLQSAMANIARGAIAAGASLEEMLPAIGLVRNTGAEASVAAHGVSAAIAHMATARDKFSALGVSITDANGAFRPFLDVVYETDQALSRIPNEAERSARANELFGHFGVGAWQSISLALRRGVRDNNGVLHQGAAAIGYLRDQMTNASGAAREFREQMLNTFAGQLTMLNGSFETLKITLGEAFGPALRPIVEGAIGTINVLISFIQGIPVGVRNAIGRTIVIFGALLTALGGFIAAGAAIALIAPFLKAIAIAVGGLLLAMLPLIVAFGALAGAIYAVHAIAERNANVARGLARAWDYVRLTFLGLSQAITEGAFSGAVMEELDRAENSGIRRFVLQVSAIGFRIVQFFRGIGIGFQTAIDHMGPAVTALMNALSRLGDAFGGVAEGGTKAIAALPSERFASSGARIGAFIGRVVEVVVKFLTIATEVATGLVHGWQSTMTFLGPIFEDMGKSFGFLGDQFSELGETLGIVSGEQRGNASGWQTFGEILGGVVATGISIVAAVLEGIALVIGGVVASVNFLVRGFRWMYMEGQLAAVGIARFFGNVADTIMNLVDRFISAHAALARLVPAQLRPAGLDALIAAGNAADARIVTRGEDARVRNTIYDAMSAEAMRAPAAVEASARADREAVNQDAMTRVQELIRQQAIERKNQPTVVNVQVDGETIATAIAPAQRREEAASFGQPARGAEG